MVRVGTVLWQLVVDYIVGMDYQQSIQDNSKLDFVKHRKMHQYRMGMVRTDSLVQHSRELCSGFQ